jgi:hypothetical protein
LSLHSTDAGKSDYKEESKNSFSHGGERKQTARLQSTYFHRTNPAFCTEKQQITTTSHPHHIRNSIVLDPVENLKTAEGCALERGGGLRYSRHWMLDTILGCLKWAAVGFIVAFALMKLFEASHIHDDIPKPAFKIRQTKRATFVLSAFAAMLSALVWLLVQKLD